MKGFLGTWKVVQRKGPKNGNVSWLLPLGQRVNTANIDRVRFDDVNVEFANLEDGSSRQMEYEIDPAKKTLDLFEPARYDFDQSGRLLNPPIPQNERLAALGVYELEGGRFAIHLAHYLRSLKRDQRPKDVYGEPGFEDLILVLERYQPTEEEKAIAGDWAVISQVEDGKVIPDEITRKTRLRFSLEGCFNHFIVFSSDYPNVAACGQISSLYWGRFTLNPGGRAKSISLLNNRIVKEYAIATVSETLHGIYKLDGGRLAIAFRKGDAPPEKFESAPGSGITLLELQVPKPAAASKPVEPAAENGRH